MRLQLTPRVLACLLAASWTATALADEASGTWSGSLEGRGNYYWERSTRVVVPAARLELTAPNGVRIGAGYLVDVISSASIAQGVQEDAVHTEVRHGPTADLGKEFDLGDSQLDLSVHGTYSTESDYESVIYGLSTALMLDDKNTRLRLSASRVQDEIRNNADPAFEGELSGTMLGAGFERVLNPVTTIALSYQFGYLEGYLGNTYRTALIGPLPHRERPPGERFRHTASARLAWFIPATNTALHLIYSAYVDSWNIAALNPEIRLYQHFGRDFVIRPRYRFYAQTRASFQRDTYPGGWDGPITNDPKLTEFTTHAFGASLEYRVGFLEGTGLDFARNTWFDLSFDRYLSTNAFGNGVIATAGGRIEF